MKKILAVLMSAMLLLGILAGCNAEPPATDPTNKVSTPVAAGMLVLNAEATVNISYDADGLVLDIEAADDNGSIVVGEYEGFLGKTCSDAVCDLISGANRSGFLTEESTYIMIKQALGSALPGSTFLETIVKDAEAALTAAGLDAAVVLVTAENLDENGYIDLETAKALMLAYIARDSFDTLDGTTAPIDGAYGFAVTAGDLEGSYIIDAVTGDVFEGELEGAFEEEIDDETNEELPTEEIIEETGAASQPAETTNESDEETTA